jgi:HEAT repeat protein
MGFYNLPKEEIESLVEKIRKNIFKDIESGKNKNLLIYFSDEDTYIRKTAYTALAKIYKEKKKFQKKIVGLLEKLSEEENFHIRQSAVNSAGEIGIFDFNAAEKFLEKGLFDNYHSVRNAVIGSPKKTRQKNPTPSLKWAKKFLHHPDKEIRREICHGIELRRRTHPEDILPMLQELEFDKTPRVRNTLVHVLGQIAYKKNCLEKVLNHLKKWNNKELVKEAAAEIIDVHERYKDFAAMS